MKTIPIAAAKKIADDYKQSHVILISYSKEKNITYVTTFGKTDQDCDDAAQGANWLKEHFLKWPESECIAEPDRVKKLKDRVSELEQQLKKTMMYISKVELKS